MEDTRLESLKYWARFLTRGSGRLLVSCAKNYVKVLIGRPMYFDPRVVCFMLYVRQRVARRPIRKLTCEGFSGEGAGSQALTIMYAISFARACSLTYLHTPFKSISHADRPMREWVDAWETHFNLGEGESSIAETDRDAVNFAYNFTDLKRFFHVRDLDPLLMNMLPEFRRKYRKNKTRRANDFLVIGVHIRRGDPLCTFDDWHNLEKFRPWTATEIVLRTTRQAKALLEKNELTFKIRVFSTGSGTDFISFRQLGAELFLNVDSIWTMQELIEADVLIMAKESFFSYVAGFLSDGIKISEPCIYARLDNWIVFAPTGEFDSSLFERQLSELIKRKSFNDRCREDNPIDVQVSSMTGVSPEDGAHGDE